MNKKRLVKALLVVALLSATMTFSSALLAADDTNTETASAEAVPENPIGLGVLMFLLGAGGIITVGGVMMARDSFSTPRETV